MVNLSILHAPPYEMTHLSIPMTDRYFTVDTAERGTLEGWKKKNPHNLTYAFKNHDGEKEFMGFIGILPLTMECGQMFEQQDLLEADVTADEILPPETMRYAQYLYISSIAIRDLETMESRQTAAALVSCGAGVIRHLYGGGYLKKIFANPTTFQGNRIIGRFGLKPLTAFKNGLHAGNNIYGVDVTPDYMNDLAALEKRYQRFIIDYPWPLT